MMQRFQIFCFGLLLVLMAMVLSGCDDDACWSSKTEDECKKAGCLGQNTAVCVWSADKEDGKKCHMGGESAEGCTR